MNTPEMSEENAVELRHWREEERMESRRLEAESRRLLADMARLEKGLNKRRQKAEAQLRRDLRLDARSTAALMRPLRTALHRLGTPKGLERLERIRKRIAVLEGRL